MTKRAAIVLLFFAVSSRAQDTAKIATPRYWTAFGVAALSTAADTYTTLTVIHPQAQRCNVEVGSPWLYGSEPKPARTILMMAGELAFTSVASYELKKHHRRLWVLPLAFTIIVHSRAAIYNTVKCG